jgi:methylmalonyl-CoA epimerase
MAGPRGPSHLDHVGIAVRSIAEALRFYEALGLRLEGEEEVAGQAVRVAFLPLGETRLELLEPSSPESPIARHLDRRGPSLHHLCVSVPDIRAAMAQLAGAGFELLSDDKPLTRRMAGLAPAALLGAGFLIAQIALGYGAGGESRRPLGLAVVGGLIFSQTLTLYVTPVFYVYMEKLQDRLHARRAAVPSAVDADAG